MAHFYATVTGKETHGAYRAATKTGTKKSGMLAHVRGWDVGVLVKLKHDERTQEDLVEVYATDGSNGGNSGELLARFNGKTWTHYPHGAPALPGGGA